MTVFNQTIHSGEGAFISFFSTLITIGLFYIGILIEIKRYKSRLKSDHKNQLKFFKKLLEKSLSHINDVKSNINKFSDDVKSNPYDVILPTKKVNEYLKRLCAYDNKPFFNSFTALSSKTPDDFISLYNSLDFFNLRIQQIFDQNEKHVHNQNKNQWYIKKKLDRLFFTLQDIFEFNLPTGFSPDVLKEAKTFLDTIGNLTEKSRNVNDVAYFHKLFSITEDTYISILNLLKNDPLQASSDALYLLSQLRDIANRFTHMQNNSVLFAKEITFGEEINEPLRIVNDSITELNLILR